jgi:multimeric flavodoxin WrbA
MADVLGICGSSRKKESNTARIMEKARKIGQEIGKKTG